MPDELRVIYAETMQRKDDGTWVLVIGPFEDEEAAVRLRSGISRGDLAVVEWLRESEN